MWVSGVRFTTGVWRTFTTPMYVNVAVQLS